MIIRVILGVESRDASRKIESALSGGDILIQAVGRREGLWKRLGRENADVLVLSPGLAGEPPEQTVAQLRALPDSPMVVIVVEGGDLEEQARWLAAGAEAVVDLGLSSRRLRAVLAAVLARRQSAAETAIASRRQFTEPRLADFASSSPAMHTFMRMVERVVPNDVALLILGETGVGKERLARAVHAEGARSTGPFIAVNCGALPESLLESELFGHEEGAFTGATRSRRGWFELAHKGTIFLDEVGDMPGHLQVKLLRVLQEHEIQRVGSEKAVRVDVRVMAATNRDLEADAEAGRFRRDLYYRLGVVTLTVPALRERVEDIPALAQSYINYFRPRIGREVHGIEPDALDALRRYPWPGNVRELMNVIERAMLLCTGWNIGCEDLPATIHGGPVRVILPPGETEGENRAKRLPDAWLHKPWRAVRKEFLDNLERSYLARLLEDNGGHIGRTARRAGMRPRSLFEKMRKYGLKKEDYRRDDGRMRTE